MHMEAGMRTFYKGLMPTLLQLFPYAGFQFGFYALFNSMWEFSFGKPEVKGQHKTGMLTKVSINCLECKGVKYILLTHDKRV